MNLDEAVMARLRAPFGCEFIRSGSPLGSPLESPLPHGRWRIHDANDDAVASVSGLEEGYARLIVQALNEHFERRMSTVNAVVEAVRVWGRAECGAAEADAVLAKLAAHDDAMERARKVTT